MKQGRNPSRKEKEFLESKGWVVENWLVRKVFVDGLEIVNKKSGNVKFVFMQEVEKNG